jgi:tRNA threonylcarbamoyladenosine biosynthesis protein TsaE
MPAGRVITKQGKYLCRMELIYTLEQINCAADKLLVNAAGYKVIAIRGAMGAGKTTLIHACCEVLGVRDHVSSPTFSIINEYQGAEGETIYHLDLYRLRDEEEAISSGVEDCLYSGNTCFVEWPEKAPGIFPDDSLFISIEPVGENRRKLVITEF